MPATAERSSISLTSPVTPTAPITSPEAASRTSWPPPSRNIGPEASFSRFSMKIGFSRDFCSTSRDERPSASAA
jgi:hypothetical protein